MAQFLRFALLIIVALVGFGSGICGLLGFAASTTQVLEHGGRFGADGWVPGVMLISAVGVALAVGCFFIVRVLIRRMRGAGPPPPTDVPPAGPPGPAAPPVSTTLPPRSPPGP